MKHQHACPICGGKVCKNCGKEISYSCKSYLCQSCSMIGNKKALGNKHSKKAKSKMSKSKLGENNPNWKGYDYKFKYPAALHQWVKRNWKNPPKICQRCNKKPAFDLANKGVYDRNFSNWEWLCRRCHMDDDKRIKNLKQYDNK